MLLKNGIILLSGFLGASYNTSSVVVKTTQGNTANIRNGDNFEWKSASNQTYGINTKYEATGDVCSTSNSTFPNIFLGDGDTPVTPDDYALSGNLVTPTKQGGLISSITNNNITYSCNVTNDTDTEMTIREVGFGSYRSYTGGSAGDCAVMWSREVLDTPITIPPQTGKTITITIDFSKLWE